MDHTNVVGIWLPISRCNGLGRFCTESKTTKSKLMLSLALIQLSSEKQIPGRYELLGYSKR
jgi:hypothetical protein